MADFSKDLPRLADLHSRFVTCDKRNFFYCFPARLEAKDTVTFDFYRIIENWMSYIPASEWEIYAAKIGPAALAYDEKRKRHWEKLHDVFSEAVGAMVLVKEFRCGEVRLVPASKSIAPDWRGVAAGRPHYVEVKTVNHSLEERLSWYDGAQLVHTTLLPETLKGKIHKGYKEAVAQLSAPADANAAIKVAAFVLYPDYNVDPIEVELSSLFMDFCTEIELPDYPIRLRIFENA
jgi:hypothetical protein